MFSTPLAFSIFAISLIFSPPFCVKNSLTSRTFCAQLTNDSAKSSALFFIANFKSSSSAGEMYGVLGTTFGTFSPLLFDKTPPNSTLHAMSVFVICPTTSTMRPLLAKILSPILTSLTRFLYFSETMFSLPTTSFVVNVNTSPALSSICPSLNVPILISGPFVSTISLSPRSRRKSASSSTIFCCESTVP